MSQAAFTGALPAHRAPAWTVWTILFLGIAAPVLGTFLFQKTLHAWHWRSLPFHSTLEVAGAAIGIVLGFMILFSRQSTKTTRRLWVALALITMSGLDIFHSSVPVGVSFVWLHSVAVLAGGIFFALVWFPGREISSGTAVASAGAALIFTVLFGAFSAVYPEGLPDMVVNGGFTPAANVINFLGGGLTLLAAVNFALHYYRSGNREELLFLLLCLLFGGAGVLFQMSAIWEGGWWFWHILRLGGYIMAFWLAMLSFRRSEEEMIRTHGELNSMFHTAVDGKRLIDRDFNQMRSNEPFAAISGIARETAENMKCHEVLKGPLCHTDECPMRQFELGFTGEIEREITKTRRDGRKIVTIIKASRLDAPDGTFKGIMESFLDITDRKSAEDQVARQAAQKTAQAELSELMRGDETAEVCRNIITFLCKYLEAQTGLIYLADETGNLNLLSSYAHKRRKHLADHYGLGEGLVGQAALEKEEIILTQVPEDYITVESGLGKTVPRNILVKPIVHDDAVIGVIELGTLNEFTDAQRDFMNMVINNIAVAIDSTKSRSQLALSLTESQRLSAELQSQQEELRVANEELEEQTERLKTSEERLKTQQEELQVTNEELEEKNELLERQKREVEHTRKEIEEKAEALALASKYKSEFLANMSHELRTPLNSLLLLAQALADNKEKNLTEKQTEWARIIHGSGSDLLNLINEILDLSKIEAGRMDLELGPVQISDLADSIQNSFGHMAEEKGLELAVGVRSSAPVSITTDHKRVEQIIRNLVSNAIKFTDTGSVKVHFERPAPGRKLPMPGLTADNALAISVTDTGIGVAPEQQKIIFEAFQQAEGGTARRHGGTGLGLSISRELAHLLGGGIALESTPEKGATFTLFLPEKIELEKAPKPLRPSHAVRLPPAASTHDYSVSDDRDNLGTDDQIILVIEDDSRFANVLCEKCRQRGLKCLAAPSGEAGLALAAQYHPKGIILDLRLPSMDGWEVLEALKENIHTRHIPVHIVSVEETSTESLKRGAVGHSTKPLTQEELEAAFKLLEETAVEGTKRVLIVEDDDDIRNNLKDLIGDRDVEVDEAATGEAAVKALHNKRYGCLILDLRLPDMEGAEMLKALKAEEIEMPPVIVHTARELTAREEMELREHAESIVIKDVRSQERLLDEVSLFLHRMVGQMPKRKEQIIRNLHETDVLLKGKKILVVDDDMRTTFALSHLLQEHGMMTLKAENGERALRILAEKQDVDLVLMDIMMPMMDGYETMRRIRADDRFRNLPIIALTAKAMPEDRKKCIDAGANDYLPKPIDHERLFSMMRVWLYR